MKELLRAIKILAAFVCILEALAKADSVDPFNTDLPDSVMMISDPDSLGPYLQSQKSDDRIHGIIRLGDIGKKEAANYLINLYENEPTSSASDIIKYQSLRSLGKIGGPIAEDFLLNVVSSLSTKINKSTQAFSIQDSMTSLLGGYEGLYYVNSTEARDLLNSIYENKNLYWLVRSFAYDEIVKFNLMDQHFQTPADSINYLIDGLKDIGPDVSLIIGDEEINDGYLKRRSIVNLLFQYYESSLPILNQAISELPPGDPMLPEFEKIRTNMENNPPVPGN